MNRADTSLTSGVTAAMKALNENQRTTTTNNNTNTAIITITITITFTITITERGSRNGAAWISKRC